MADAFLLRPTISSATARQLVDAALDHATKAGVAVSVAVSDPAGNLVAGARMDAAPLGSMRLATDKAFTAASWQMRSGDLRLSTQPGGADWGLTTTEGGRIVVYDGGFPLFFAGVLGGAIGVSGGTGEQDAACAQAAIAAVLPDA